MSKRDNMEFHWFVSSAFHWRTGYNLRTMLVEISKADKALYRDKKKYKEHEKGVSLWRVPGPDTSTYEINYFNPQVEGALYIGPIDISEGLMAFENEDQHTMHLEEKKKGSK